MSCRSTDSFRGTVELTVYYLISADLPIVLLGQNVDTGVLEDMFFISTKENIFDQKLDITVFEEVVQTVVFSAHNMDIVVLDWNSPCPLHVGL